MSDSKDIDVSFPMYVKKITPEVLGRFLLELYTALKTPLVLRCFEGHPHR